MSILDLKKHLVDAYSGFADKRIKKLTSGDTFIVDDRGSGDVGADRQLYPYFCMMFAVVIDADTVEVRLSGNVPLSPAVRAWIKDDSGSTLSEEAYRSNLEVRVQLGDEDRLDELAKLIASITQKKYDVPSYKYVCPRPSESLRRLADVLRDFT